MLRQATTEDTPQLAQVLARAFADDPFYVWLIPRGEQEAARTLLTFELLLERLSAELKDTYTTHDLSGAAVWKAPGELHLPLMRQLLLLPAFGNLLGWRRIPGVLRMVGHMESLHRQLVPEPHFYLFLLGVDPPAQGRGLGSLLMEPTLARCDREQRRAYLETSHADNLRFYERHGFQVVNEIDREGWPKLWLMVREPRAYE